MSTYKFRAAQPADWKSVSELLATYHLPLDGVQDHLATFQLAFENDQLVGTAGLEVYGEVALLRSVAVATQGKGLGQQLVKSIIQMAAESNIKQLVLLTTTAVGYFPRFGFRQVQRSAVPETVMHSVEFQDACPESATVMLLDLQETPHPQNL